MQRKINLYGKNYNATVNIEITRIFRLNLMVPKKLKIKDNEGKVFAIVFSWLKTFQYFLKIFLDGWQKTLLIFSMVLFADYKQNSTAPN